ncbi:MAG TPA: pitrilysin family protein [Bacteroidia bacterium]|nr:pitrilysin family protein [Bacteroidia bacterium]
MEHSTKTFALKNGLQLVLTSLSNTEVSHCALLIKAGTRNEQIQQEGLAHFIEHMLFKGTRKRKSFHILNRLEVVGGELNAFTSKEETCIHASVTTPHLERALELISDITFNSVFNSLEIEKEKEVVCDEIRSYLDNPGEQIFDDFEGIVFKKNPLGNPILGTENSVRNFKQKDLIAFTRKFYIPSNMVLSVASSLKAEKVIRQLEHHFGKYRLSKVGEKPKPFKKYTAEKTAVKKHNAQCHFIMGTLAPSLYQADRMTVSLLNNILGGPGMNSKLNLGVREKYGYTYAIESGFNSYTDTGMFHVYLATDKKFLNKSIDLAVAEMKKLTDNKIGTLQLSQYKQQLKGQLALAKENKSNVVISNARSLLNFKKVTTLEDIYKKIDAVTSSQLVEAAAKYLNAKSRSYSSLLYESVSHE